MAYDKRPGAAALYRLDPDHSVCRVIDGLTISNGIDWSPDGTHVYYNDTATFRTDIFDYDRDAGLTNRRPFVDYIPEDLRPDGLTVDADDGVWVAFANGGAVRRYTAAGVLDGIVELPVTKVTACTFGGPQLDQLFITTSQEGLAPGNDPAAGSLFRAEAGVRGMPAREFAG
jgi:sugar lactone lactonase YvrE